MLCLVLLFLDFNLDLINKFWVFKYDCVVLFYLIWIIIYDYYYCAV